MELDISFDEKVSIHSRVKAAASNFCRHSLEPSVSTHSCAKAATALSLIGGIAKAVSTHSRAKAAAFRCHAVWLPSLGFNTQPRGGGCHRDFCTKRIQCLFQHTAARRRLPYTISTLFKNCDVSTHSRAEAAAFQNT